VELNLEIKKLESKLAVVKQRLAKSEVQ
jgi:hypothetical protein